MSTTVDARLKGTQRSYFFREFFTNSAYFPIANIILELLMNDPGDYLSEPDLYFILLAALAQAAVISRWQYFDSPRPMLGNLIGPFIYTLFELLAEGGEFFENPNHIAYWSFSIGIGLAQQLRLWQPRYATPFILLENLLRTSIILVMYTIFEFIKDDYTSMQEFMHDPTHMFIVITVPFIGLLIGFANSNAERYLAILRDTAAQLKEYSEWLLGRELLSQAVDNPQVLSLKRHKRAMLFMDIRGFTAWSERQQPEQVVALMNGYYEAAEPVWRYHQAIKVKFTADEIMLIFADTAEAMQAAILLRDAVVPVLQPHGLSAGVGLHTGPVVEGLMGARDYKGYDLLGDSVNTAKRLCDSAAGGEILISQQVRDELGDTPAATSSRQIQVKGKQEPLLVHAFAGA